MYYSDFIYHTVNIKAIYSDRPVVQYHHQSWIRSITISNQHAYKMVEADYLIGVNLAVSFKQPCPELGIKTGS